MYFPPGKREFAFHRQIFSGFPVKYYCSCIAVLMRFIKDSPPVKGKNTQILRIVRY